MSMMLISDDFVGASIDCYNFRKCLSLLGRYDYVDLHEFHFFHVLLHSNSCKHASDSNSMLFLKFFRYLSICQQNSLKLSQFSEKIYFECM